MSQNKTELIETLLEAGVLKYDEVTEAAQFPGGGSLLEKALTLGFGNENDALKILSNRMSLATIEGEELVSINSEVLQNLPKDVLVRHHILPFFADDIVLNIAMIDPTDDACLNEIAFFTELKIFPYGVLASKLTKAMNRYFGMGLPEVFMHKSRKSESPMAGPSIAQPTGLPSTPTLPPRPNNIPPRPEIPTQVGPVLPSPPTMPPMPNSSTGINLPPRPAQQQNIQEEKTKIESVNVQEEKSVVVDALKQQKEALEEDFNKRLEDMKKRFSKLEEDKKIDKLKEELEERLEIKRTMDKLSEIERMRYMGGQQFIPPYYNMPYGQYYQPVQPVQPVQQPQQQQQMPQPVTEQPKTDSKNDELATMLSKQIEELKKQMSELSKIAAEKMTVQEAPKVQQPQSQPPEAPKEDLLPDIDNIVNDMKSTPAKVISTELGDELILSDINVDVVGIIKGKDKEHVLQAIVTEMQKISKRAIILFVKYENLVGVAGFGEYVSDRVTNFSTTIILPGIFKKIYDSKKPIHGQLELSDVMKKFLDYFGGIRPDKVTLAPAVLKNRVFAMVYAEEVKELNEVIKITDAMSEAFSTLLSQR